MATKTKQKLDEFSIANFKFLFNASRAKKYLSEMELKNIQTALEEKNLVLLRKLYEVLLQEYKTDEQIVQNFVMTQNRILNDLGNKAEEIKKQYIELPRKKRIAKIENKEHLLADEILNQL